MKAIIKFLLHTAVGRAIVSEITRALIQLFKKKVLEKMEPYKRDNLERALNLADQELHADIDAGKITLL